MRSQLYKQTREDFSVQKQIVALLFSAQQLALPGKTKKKCKKCWLFTSVTFVCNTLYGVTMNDSLFIHRHLQCGLLQTHQNRSICLQYIACCCLESVIKLITHFSHTLQQLHPRQNASGFPFSSVKVFLKSDTASSTPADIECLYFSIPTLLIQG